MRWRSGRGRGPPQPVGCAVAPPGRADSRWPTAHGRARRSRRAFSVQDVARQAARLPRRGRGVHDMSGAESADCGCGGGGEKPSQHYHTRQSVPHGRPSPSQPEASLHLGPGGFLPRAFPAGRSNRQLSHGRYPRTHLLQPAPAASRPSTHLRCCARPRRPTGRSARSTSGDAPLVCPRRAGLWHSGLSVSVRATRQGSA